jgi:hypothetical protein
MLHSLLPLSLHWLLPPPLLLLLDLVARRRTSFNSRTNWKSSALDITGNTTTCSDEEAAGLLLP